MVKQDATMGLMDTRKGAVTYSRVSSDGQVEGFSLDIQVRETRKAAEKLGCPVLRDFVEEGVSGTLEDRPALAELLAFCAQRKGEVQYVVVKDIDRFSRETLVHQILKSKLRALGVSLYSINQPTISEDSPHARFMENIFSSVAQLERDQIVQRCASGTKEAVLRGAWTCRAPYGFRNAKTIDGIASLAIVEEHAEAVRKAFRMYADGDFLSIVADRLNTLGYRTRKGGKFSKQTIDNILRNAAYIGKIQHGHFPDQLIDGLHPPIISEALWGSVQARFENRLPTSQKMKVNPDFLLTNILRCPKCSGPMKGSFHRGKSGKRYPYYSCRLGTCGAKAIPRDKMHQEFLDSLGALAPTESCIEAFESSIIAVWREKWQACCDDKVRFARRLTDLELKRDAIVDKYITGKLDESLYRRHLALVEDEILKVGEQRAQHVLSEAQMRELLEFSRGFLSSPLNTWESATLERKRVVQRLIFPMGLRPEADGTLQTLDVSPLLRLVQPVTPSESNMVELRGLEPLASSMPWKRSTS
jgi:site-specific DNA recombinase